jgi:hypothetical protein
MDKLFLAKQLNALFRLAGQNLNITDAEKMQIADLYPAWEAGKAYAAGTIVKYGANQWGETQLYSVLQAHTSQEDWKPDASTSLYKAIGFTDDGVPVWTQPLGDSDAYGEGDTVSFSGEIWISTVGGNVWQPGGYGWEKASRE